MIDNKLKENIQMLICGDLERENKAELEAAIKSSDELQNYYHSSKLAWDKLDNLSEIEPSKTYVSDFWKKADNDKNKAFNIFKFLGFQWKLAGSVAVFLIASFFTLNYYGSESINEFTFSEDVEIMNQLDNAITLNSDSSLEVYGPW